MLKLIFRVRFGVLGLLAAAAAGACVLFPAGLPLRATASAFVVAAVISFVHLRHITLALTAALAPIPGLLIAHAAGAASPLMIALCYLPGFACAAFLADEIAARITSGIERRAAAEDALGGLGVSALLAVIVAAFGLAAFWALFRPHASLAMAAATLGAGISAILIVPLAASFLPFSEDYVTRANRLREWRERMLDPATAAVEPRWAMSMSGIAIIFAVLGYFGAHPVLDARQAAILVALLLAVSVITFALTQEWRRAISLPVVLAILMLIALWGFAQIHMRLSPRSLLLLLQTLGVCIVPMILFAVEAGRHLNEDVTSAASFALVKKGPCAVFFFIAAIIVTLAQFDNVAMSLVFSIVILFGCVGAVLAAPAIATALEMLIPRKTALEARYRVR